MGDAVKLSEINLTARDGSPVHLAYEESADILEVVFLGVEADCSLELTDYILLSFNRAQGKAAGLTFLDFSALATPSEYGPRTFVLSGLEGLPDAMADAVISMLLRPPVSQFLKLVSFQASGGKTIPLTYFEHSRAEALAA